MNNEESSFMLDTHVTFGLIGKASLRDLENLKSIIKKDFPRIYVIYTKTTMGNLWLKKGDDPDD